jgi:hypothetical protein
MLKIFFPNFESVSIDGFLYFFNLLLLDNFAKLLMISPMLHSMLTSAIFCQMAISTDKNGFFVTNLADFDSIRHDSNLNDLFTISYKD